MADVAIDPRTMKARPRQATGWNRLKVNRDWLGFWFMLPAAGFLVLFLAYPLGLGVWMSFTDTRIGRPGVFIGIENYEWLLDLLALGVQYSALHDRRQRVQIRNRALSCYPAQ